MYKKFLSTLLALCVVLTLLPGTACAADINDAGVFLKQQTSTTCTLASATMMIRRRGILDRDAGWSSITENAVKKYAWAGGLSFSFQYNGCHVTTYGLDSHQITTLQAKKDYISKLLTDHPEGIVVYNHSKPHAVLMTDYDSSTDTFFCADPLGSGPTGRVPFSQCTIPGNGQDAKLKNINQVWYIDYGSSSGAGTDGTGAEPSPPPSPTNNLLVVSPNAVSINSGQTAQVNLTVNRSQKFTTHVEIADNSICSGQWEYNSFRGSGSKWTNNLSLTGLKGGSTTVKIDVYDVRSGALLDTKVVTVTVVPPPAPKLDLQLDAWISPKGHGFSIEQAAQDRISQGKVGEYYYLWFKLYDTNTGKRLNELYSYNYNSNMTIIAPDCTPYTADYKNSDNNWRGFPVTAAGTYTCKITFTGNIIGASSFKFNVEADKLVMTPDKTSITVELGKSSVCNLTASRTTQTKYVDKSVANGDICEASFGELSYPSNNTVLIPMHIIGKKVGQTTVTPYILDANKNKLVSSSPITITVTEPASPPTVTLDKNEISIIAGEKASVNATLQTYGATLKAEYRIENSTICTGTWDKSASTGNKCKLDILGLSEGVTTITVYLIDNNGNTVASQKITVSVSPKPSTVIPLKLSTSASSVSVEEGDSQPIEISWSGTVPAGSKLNVSATPDPNRAGSISLRWGNKGSTSRTIMVTGNREGGSTLNIALTDSNGNVLTSTSVNVLVCAKKKEASVSLSPESTTIKLLENRAITVNYQGDYYRRTLKFDNTGTFLVLMNAEDYPGSSETISITGIKAGTDTCRVVLEDEYGNELASTVLTVTVIDDTSLDDDINSDDYTYSTPSTVVGDSIMAQYLSRSAKEYSLELEDEIANSGSLTGQGNAGIGGGQNQALSGFSASGSLEIKVDSTSVNTSGNAEKKEPAVINTIPAGSITSTGVGTDTASMTFSVTISDPASSSPSTSNQNLRFTDVISDKYYYEPVVWAEQTGVTAGITGTTLNPNGNCPRGQVVEFIWRTLGSPKPKLTENPFTDVDSDDSYYDAVLWAYESSVTTGTSKTAFSPNDTCTRGQVMTFLWRAKGKPTVSGGNPFTDVADTAYYADAVNWAVETAITTGTSATSFSPKNLCSRAQILTFLHRSISGGVEKS